MTPYTRIVTDIGIYYETDKRMNLEELYAMKRLTLNGLPAGKRCKASGGRTFIIPWSAVDELESISSDESEDALVPLVPLVVIKQNVRLRHNTTS